MNRRIGFWVAALALFAACNKEVPVQEPVKTPPVQTPAPVVHTLTASVDGDEPPTRSRLTFDASAARVLWSRGDEFKMAIVTNSGVKTTVYTTQNDGVEKGTFTTTGTLAQGNAYTSGYPADVCRVGRKGEVCVLDMPIPSAQVAVPGGIADGLNRAAAYSTRQDVTSLKFFNLLSMVRFRVEGDCVGQLASVTFHAETTLAGDATVWFESGRPCIDFSKNWSPVTEERSTDIVLSGSFVAGQDYCMVMAPASLEDGFDMIFTDTKGRTIQKHSSKALTLERSRIIDLGTIALGDNWEYPVPKALIKYMTQTQGTRPNVIGVLAEGFTKEEMDKFETLAKSGMDYMFNTEPYKTYKDYFTVYLCRVPSNESGASVTDGNGNITLKRDTAFDVRWGADSYSDMKGDPAKVQKYLKENIPEIVSGTLSYVDVPTLLIVNDTRYGGMNISYSNGWAYCIVPYAKNGAQMRWSFPSRVAVNPEDDSEGYRSPTSAELDAMGRHVGDWRNTLIHEFGGHGYGRLSDEYWSSSSASGPGAIDSHSWSVPLGLNVSGYYGETPWSEDILNHLNEWVELNPDYARVGRYQGAKTSLYFRWRSEPTSCMIDNRPYYNLWSRILIVRRILGKAGVAFDMNDFKSRDVSVDPIRPSSSSTPASLKAARKKALAVPEMPPLPPPVLIEVD